MQEIIITSRNINLYIQRALKNHEIQDITESDTCSDGVC